MVRNETKQEDTRTGHQDTRQNILFIILKDLILLDIFIRMQNKNLQRNCLVTSHKSIVNKACFEVGKCCRNGNRVGLTGQSQPRVRKEEHGMIWYTVVSIMLYSCMVKYSMACKGHRSVCFS